MNSFPINTSSQSMPQISDLMKAIYELSPIEKQLLSTVLAKMKLEDEDSRTYSISAKYLYEENELDIEQIMKQLLEIIIKMSLGEGKNYKVQLLNSVQYLEDEELLRLSFTSE